MTRIKTDLLIIGGGINGAGIARDAAMRGLSVVLAEKDDLASHTSSWSSKLIHGGLRYLEYYEFGLVRKALKEREVLLKISPNLIHPLRFVMPHNKHCRPFWMLRLGLFLYDFLYWQHSLARTKQHRISADDPHNPLKPFIKKTLEYSDASVDDARLVVMNAKQAMQYGASILTNTEVKGLKRVGNLWEVTLFNKDLQKESVLEASAVVNAAGPWVDQVIKDVADMVSSRHVKLIKGSHIVVPKLYDGDNAYILQHDDNRIVFAIPFQNAFTLIGTTDIAYKGDRGSPKISQEETSYLLDIINVYFKKPIRKDDIVWTFSGVRPLFDSGEENPSALTRDYVLHVDVENNEAPLLSVFGGKITTYRYLSKEALDQLKPHFPQMKACQTGKIPLPGGDLKTNSFDDFLSSMQKKYDYLDQIHIHRLALAYGSDMNILMAEIHSTKDLGMYFGGTLYAHEVDYLIKHEWARTSEDILWRRTKQGLYFSKEQTKALERYLQHASVIAAE